MTQHPACDISTALDALHVDSDYAETELAQADALGITPLPRLTYEQFLAVAVLRYGDDHVVFEFPDIDMSMTLGELSHDARRFAKALLAAGITHGDNIAIWSPPTPLWPIAMFGSALIGATVSGLNTRYRREELSHVFSITKPAIIFTATGFNGIDSLKLINTALTQAQHNTHHVTWPIATPTRQLTAFLGTGDGINDNTLLSAAATVQHRDASLIQFTSGSTGAPKAVLISQSGSTAAAHYGAECVGLNHHDRLYSPLPLFHIGGTITTVLATVASGCTTVLPQRFHARTALTALADNCTAFHGHGALWRILLEEHRSQPLPLPPFTKGWASGDPAFMRALHNELGVTDLTNMYGSSESGTIACTVPSDPIDQRLGTLGRPTPGTRTTIRSADGDPVDEGQVGELWLSGVMSMIGYLGEEPRHDTNEWIHTGDLVRQDGDYLVYAGRLDDRLKPGGENVSITEVESFIAKDPHVTDVVVVGVPDKRLGDVVAAVVRTSSDAATENTIQSRCRDNIASFKVPKYVRIVPKFPTLETGKIDRRRVREELLEHLRTDRGIVL